MKCQMPGCNNKGIKAIKKDGIFLGVHLENVAIFTCEKHSIKEIELELEKIGEEEASFIEHECNPFMEAPKLIKKRVC